MWSHPHTVDIWIPFGFDEDILAKTHVVSPLAESGLLDVFRRQRRSRLSVVEGVEHYPRCMDKIEPAERL